MKIITLNLQCGMKLPEILNFINRYAKETDIFCFQEVASGYRFKLQYQKKEFNDQSYEDVDLFKELNRTLNKKFNNRLSKSYYDRNKHSYIGNCIFYRKGIKFTTFKSLFMGNNNYVELSETRHENVRYSCQFLKLEYNNEPLNVINVHMLKYVADPELAEDYFRRLSLEISNLKENFILCGDLNIDVNHYLINKYFINYSKLNMEYKIFNTLNKRSHCLFVKEPDSKGLSVDQFITNAKLHNSVECLYEDVSDHYPILATF